MSGDLVFTVEGSVATPATPISLSEAGLKERRDLQEWVLAHPELLGDGVFVITCEFDRWQGYDGSRERDRLDVLGVDAEGRLVLAELKRDKAPETVEMQAIKYAAMVSRFTEDHLVEQLARFRSRAGDAVDEEGARQVLLEHAGELDPELLRRPRIVLLAGSFPPVTASAVVWLTEMGLDITMRRLQAYRVFEDRIVITVSQLFPVPGVEEFTVSPQRAQIEQVADRQRQKRDQSTVSQLIELGEIPDGTTLLLRPHGVSPEVAQAIFAWVAEDGRRGRARWFNDRRGPLEWELDGDRYKPTPLAKKVAEEATGASVGATRGPRWWVLPDGRDLPTATGNAQWQRFDWSRLHGVLAGLPAGRWTTYGDLAALIETAPQPLGQHIATCGECENAWRVLGADGHPRPNFAWTDKADPRTQEDALRGEGVGFESGAASPACRLRPAELASLLAGEDDGPGAATD